jgi:hypothetical protein
MLRLKVTYTSRGEVRRANTFVLSPDGERHCSPVRHPARIFIVHRYPVAGFISFVRDCANPLGNYGRRKRRWDYPHSDRRKV